MSFYTGIFVSSRPAQRNSLLQQRKWADLAQNLATQEMPPNSAVKLSRTHCRGVCAASVASDVKCLGIDIEYTDTKRNWAGILSVFCGYTDLSNLPITRLNRGWTFLEAYYKAFGTYPLENQVLEVLLEKTTDDNIVFSNGYYRYHKQIEPEFWICIIWSGSDKSPEILPIIYQNHG